MEQRENLGRTLEEYRERLSLTQKDIADRLHVSVSVIDDLESGRFRQFSAPVYLQGIVKKLIPILRIERPEELLREVRRQWEQERAGAALGKISFAQEKRQRFSVGVLRRLVFWSAGGILLATVFFIFIIKLRGFLTAPVLTIASPDDWSEIHGTGVTIKGNTQKESQLTVNGREVTINESGAFDETIELQPGLTTLEFSVENRVGKNTTVQRHIVAE